MSKDTLVLWTVSGYVYGFKSNFFKTVYSGEAQECKRDLAATECFSKRETQHEHHPYCSIHSSI